MACPNGSVAALTGPYWGNKWNQDKYATDSMTCKEYLDLCRKKRQEKQNKNEEKEEQSEDEEDDNEEYDNEEDDNEEEIMVENIGTASDDSASSTDLVYKNKKMKKSFSEYVGKLLDSFTKRNIISTKIYILSK